ncbi:MAG: hypothetical protein QF721_12435 [Verrucomicrobiota bacterium]|jgi:hypothetical protein|nr:hypothetical protein [Verrucomicrobiota bacterium]MDP7050254.1 hypothetical protein [Verrucomicrobiota bacterium]
MKLYNPLAIALLAGLATGCVNKQRITEPARSVGEQLLLSTAIDRALDELDMEAIRRLRGVKVYLSEKYLKTLDQEYLIGALRDLLFSNGVLVVDDAEQAKMIVEVRSGANSLDTAAVTFGIAEDQAMPNPLTGAAVALPELSFFKKENNFSVVKVSLVAYQADTREHVFSSRSLLGGAYDKHIQFLGLLRLRFTDVPELKTIKKRETTILPIPSALKPAFTP